MTGTIGKSTVAALRKADNRISPVQRVGKAEFAHFVEVVKSAPKPSASLRASVALMGKRKS